MATKKYSELQHCVLQYCSKYLYYNKEWAGCKLELEGSVNKICLFQIKTLMTVRRFITTTEFGEMNTNSSIALN